MRFLADENFNNTLLRALIKAAPNLDVIRVQDTEVYQANDPAVLEWAAKEGRILLTHDIRTMPKYVFERVQAGLPVSGIIEVKRDIPFQEAIDDLMVMIDAGNPADFENQVRYVPMR